MTSNQRISSYFETGTLPDLPRNHFIDDAFVAADACRTASVTVRCRRIEQSVAHQQHLTASV